MKTYEATNFEVFSDFIELLLHRCVEFSCSNLSGILLVSFNLNDLDSEDKLWFEYYSSYFIEKDE